MRLGFGSRLLDSFLTPAPRFVGRRKRAATARSGRPFYKSPGIERLESRQLAYNWGFDNGAPSFFLDSGEYLGIQCSDGLVEGCWIPASDVRSIGVYMPDGAILDLGAINLQDVPNLN